MIRRIKMGEANGIICWKLNRLTRNPIDGGELTWLLQQGIILQIFTFGRSYYPTDNVLMMSVELGMANQFVRDLSVDTKRGLKKKAEDGWYPVPSVMGYKNTPDKKKGYKTIEVDEERFHLVKKMFEMVLSRKYSASRVYDIATKEWKLTRPNGKKLNKSTWFNMLHQPFYYGDFKYNGKWYKGKHKPMITKARFQEIQSILRKNTTIDRSVKHSFPYTGLMNCGVCGRTITAENKTKYQKNGVVRHYTYYHCTAPNKTVCPQRVTNESVLDSEVMKFLETIEIPPDFAKWAIEELYANNPNKIALEDQILANKRKELGRLRVRLDNLIDMRASGELSGNQFIEKRAQAEKQIGELEDELTTKSKESESSLARIKKNLNIASEIRQKFTKANSNDTKKMLLRELCSNLTLKDQELAIQKDRTILMLTKINSFLLEENIVVRTPENSLIKRKTAPSYGQFPELLRR
jgi:site-specific DNA recombinase